MTPPYYNAGPPRQDLSRMILALVICAACLVTVFIGLLVVVNYRAFAASFTTGEYRGHHKAGNEALATGNYQTAAWEYGQMIRLRPGKADGYLLQGIAYYDLQQNKQAIQDDTLGMSQDGTSVTYGDLHYNRGLAEEDNGDYAAALVDDNLAVGYFQARDDSRYSPQDMNDRLHKAYGHEVSVECGLNDFKAAIADADLLIGRYPPWPDDYCARGEAEEGLGRIDAAVADFNRAIAIGPTYQNPFLDLSDLYDSRGEYAEEAAVWAKAVRLEPQSSHRWGSLGWAQYLAGQYTQSIATDKKALSMQPGQAWIEENMGLSYAVTGDSQDSEAAYTSAVADGSRTEIDAGLNDIRNALKKHPGSPLLLDAERILTSSKNR